MRNDAEHREQVALMRWARYQEKVIPELRSLFAIPNGGHRNIATARKMKAEGVKRGVPDLCLAVPRGEYHGLYIELKRVGGGVVSKEQKEWIARLIESGYRVEACHGEAQARKVILEYLGY